MSCNMTLSAEHRQTQPSTRTESTIAIKLLSYLKDLYCVKYKFARGAQSAFANVWKIGEGLYNKHFTWLIYLFDISLPQ